MSDSPRTEIAKPCRLPLRLRPVRVVHSQCWYCDEIFSVRSRKVGRNEEGEWLYGDVHGRPRGFLEMHYCPRCRPRG